MAAVLVLVIATLISLTGCGAKKVKKVEETTKKADETDAIHAGNTEVYLDEAKYYAYTAQATYETYYLKKQGNKLEQQDQGKNNNGRNG